jgi:hypothetical protein
MSNSGIRNKDLGKAKKTLKIVYLNVRSLISRFVNVVPLVSSYHPEILLLSETWLDSSVLDSEIY